MYNPLQYERFDRAKEGVERKGHCFLSYWEHAQKQLCCHTSCGRLARLSFSCQEGAIHLAIKRYSTPQLNPQRPS
jgi:hypothetical protein